VKIAPGKYRRQLGFGDSGCDFFFVATGDRSDWFGKTKIYELQSQGLFPMRIQFTAHTVGWVEEEIQAWLTRRIAARPCLPAPRPSSSGLRAQS
jgi:hypothetical protein